MQATRQGCFVLVRVSAEDVNRFNRQFPCSNVPDDCTLLIELDARNGDLVNITMHLEKGEYADSANYDGSHLLALCNDATNHAVKAGALPQWAKRLR
ncbi:MAG TPA: hypothetical protein VMP68_22690 [Candidatus Eisenbacteria bacterium]|nr:hypothetical protein [Candidatus Eisenbacteria bacterium]